MKYRPNLSRVFFTRIRYYLNESKFFKGLIYAKKKTIRNLFLIKKSNFGYLFTNEKVFYNIFLPIISFKEFCPILSFNSNLGGEKESRWKNVYIENFPESIKLNINSFLLNYSKKFNFKLKNVGNFPELKDFLENSKNLIKLNRFSVVESSSKTYIDPELIQISFKETKKSILKLDSFNYSQKKNSIINEINFFLKNYFINASESIFLIKKKIDISNHLKIFSFHYQQRLLYQISRKKFREKYVKNSDMINHFKKSFKKISRIFKKFNNVSVNKNFRKSDNQIATEKKIDFLSYTYNPNFRLGSVLKSVTIKSVKLKNLKTLTGSVIKFFFFENFLLFFETIFILTLNNVKHFLKIIYIEFLELKKFRLVNILFLKRFHTILFSNKDFLIIQFNVEIFTKKKFFKFLNFRKIELVKSVFYISFISNYLIGISCENSNNNFSKTRVFLFEVSSYKLEWVLLIFKKILLSAYGYSFLVEICINLTDKYFLKNYKLRKKKYQKLIKNLSNPFLIQNLSFIYNLNLDIYSNYKRPLRNSKKKISTKSNWNLVILEIITFFMKFNIFLAFYNFNLFPTKVTHAVKVRFIYPKSEIKLFFKNIIKIVFFLKIFYKVKLKNSDIFINNNQLIGNFIKNQMIFKYFPIGIKLKDNFSKNELEILMKNSVNLISKSKLLNLEAQEFTFFKYNSIAYKILIKGKY